MTKFNKTNFKKPQFILFIMLVFALSITGCASSSSVEKTAENNGTKSNVISDVESKVETKDTLKIHYIDVGQADSILIQQGKYNMLIDAGNNDDKDIVVDYLNKKGVKKLDYVIGTHPHEDHIGSLDTVINTFEIDKILMPPKTSTTKTYKDVITAIKNKNLKITLPTPGTTYNLGGATWTILAPKKNKDYEDANNYSIVCKLQYGNTSFIFTGDAEDISEKEMLAMGYDLNSDVLKVGHHGSKSSTTDSFLAAVNPKYAVITSGKDNDYGHPHKPITDKLEAKNIPIYRTDKSGTIVCTSDGVKITFNKNSEEYTPVKTTSEEAKNTKTTYFTPSGKSYHFEKDCSTLQKSKKVLQGSLEEAISLGHKDPCNVCAGGK